MNENVNIRKKTYYKNLKGMPTALIVSLINLYSV